MISHIVLFRFRDPDTAAVRSVLHRYRQLINSPGRNGLPYLVSVEGGTQASIEGLAHDYQYAFVLKFASTADRDFFAFQDREHAAFKAEINPLLGPMPASVLVFDFED